MPLEIVRNDITRMRVDAIVNAANQYLAPGGGVSRAVHQAAGPQLQEDCIRLGSCPTGSAVITAGYHLPCKYVIHAVGPIWQGGTKGEEEALRACYTKALQLAVENHCDSLAFPLISNGAYGYPKRLALKIATETITDYLLHASPDNDLMVYLVMFTKESLQVGSKLFADIRQYIDDSYVDAHFDHIREYQRRVDIARRYYPQSDMLRNAAPPAKAPAAETVQSNAIDPFDLSNDLTSSWETGSLEDMLKQMDESFSQMILRKIQEKGMKNTDCYKKANIDKKLFSKIVNNIHYKPKKSTALALAVALELSLSETKELLRKAGLALSHSEKFDIIVEYFILNHKYDIFEINEMLYEFDQPLLGGALL